MKRWSVERQSDGAHLVIIHLTPMQTIVGAWVLGLWMGGVHALAGRKLFELLVGFFS